MQQPTKLWFINSHVTIQLGSGESADGLAVMLLRLDRDDAPPQHVHRNEDEIFHVTEGSIRFLVDGVTTVVQAGQTVLGPKGRPHGFRVLSPTARMLVVAKADFEGLVRHLGRPTETDLPPPPMAPTPEMQAALAAACAAHAIDVVGPPID